MNGHADYATFLLAVCADFTRASGQFGHEHPDHPRAWHWLSRAFAGNFVREGLYYLITALPLWHDFYFYWTHRLMHTVFTL